MQVTQSKTLTVNGHQVPVKNLEKLFWPKERITKGQIMEYYIKIWPYLSRHIKDRPLSLVRYPEGIHGDFFYQKNFPDAPDWVEKIPIQSADRVIHYAMANNLESLLWSINLGCIEVHPWLSRKNALNHPTYIVIDLDPMPPAGFSAAVQVSQAFKSLLDHLKLAAFPKISGATGIHLYLPIKPVYTFKETSAFVKRLGEAVIGVLPHLATNERKIERREGKVYIDHLQNLKGKTIAAVYSLRPFPGAPVSMPVSWEELPSMQPQSFSLFTVPDYLKEKGDLFAPVLSLEQKLPPELLT
ncbi:MAG TPA: non-homologous end-joining DNA ligase [Bacillota bacterium]